MIELTQTINEANSCLDQAFNAQEELFHSMEFCTDDRGNTDTDSLAEWWILCLEEYKEGYCKLLSILAELEPYLKNYKFQYLTGKEDLDMLTEAQYSLAKEAVETIFNILYDLPPIGDLLKKVNLELKYLT